jgi:hypothetical protein
VAARRAPHAAASAGAEPERRAAPAPSAANGAGPQEQFTGVHIGAIHVEVVPAPEQHAPPAAPAPAGPPGSLARRLDTTRFQLHRR